MPYRAAEEFLTNRIDVISQQHATYSTTIDEIDRLEKLLSNSRQHPFVKESTLSLVSKSLTILRSELSNNKDSHLALLTNDSTRNKILAVIGSSIGDPYSEPDLEKIIKDGELRYAQKIPPGFKDIEKSKGVKESDSISTRCRAYGDYILWKQVIDISSSTNKDIILVTDDQKDDWWEIKNGKTIFPRPELRQEFHDLSGNNFYMYSAAKFIEHLANFLEEDVDKEVFDEIRTVSKNREIVNLKNYDSLLGKMNLSSDTVSDLFRSKYLDNKNPYDYITDTSRIFNEIDKSRFDKLSAIGNLNPLPESEIEKILQLTKSKSFNDAMLKINKAIDIGDNPPEDQ